jgi:anti-sigma-K factor RskA
MDDLRHDEVEELLGAYALDAVDDDERAAVEAHLATCPRCRAEVDAHREVAAHLAQTGAPAPDHLWDRIAGALEGEPAPPMRLVVGDRAPARRRPRWRSTPLAAAAAVVVVALVAAGGFLVGRDQGGRDVSDLQVAALAAFESPTARTAELADDGGTVLARVAVLDDGSGYLLGGALPDRRDGIYQLWGTDGDRIVSLGPMGRAPQVMAFHVDPTQTTLMISEEERPVEQPTTEPIAQGELA